MVLLRFPNLLGVLVKTPFFRTVPLLYHKFENMVILRSGAKNSHTPKFLVQKCRPIKNGVEAGPVEFHGELSGNSEFNKIFSPGLHGFHVHQGSDISTCKTLGGHFQGVPSIHGPQSNQIPDRLVCQCYSSYHQIVTFFDFLGNFRKLSSKNTTKLEKFSERYGFF